MFRDLRPYICTFSDCLDPDRLFTTRRDWIYHEMQLHRRQWICQQCSCHYISKSRIAEHIRRNHQANITDRELAVLLDISERPSDEASYDRCPFCHGTMSIMKLLDHMARHMEELALFSLPGNIVEEDIKEEDVEEKDVKEKNIEEKDIEEESRVSPEKQLQGGLPNVAISHGSSGEYTASGGGGYRGGRYGFYCVSLLLSHGSILCFLHTKVLL